MTKKFAGKAIFEVINHDWPMPDGEIAPVGALVDLSYLSVETRAWIVNKGRMRPTTDDALTITESEPEPEPPKLNKYGKPFGQVPEVKDAPGSQKTKEAK